MLTKRRARLRAKLCEFALLASATAAVEFAMVLPVMLVAYIGSIEIGSGVTADHKLANLSLTLANLTALTTKAFRTPTSTRSSTQAPPCWRPMITRKQEW